MTHASLFSGIGGCEIAAAMLGWENLFHCEINPFGRRVLEYWFPNSKSYEDITKTNFEEWRGKVDVLTGGFPCQPFSHAGLRRGAEDDRYLWPEMLRAISEIRPTWVIGENVAGLATMVEPGEIAEVGVQTDLFGAADSLCTYEHRQRFTLERVCTDLEGLGYSVQPIVIPACAVEAPHQRDRIFILAEDPMRLGLQERDGERSHTSFERAPGAEGRDGRLGLLGAALGVLATKGEDSLHDMGGANVDNTNIERWYEKQLFIRGLAGSRQAECGHEQSRGAIGAYLQDRWRRFPVESPIHRGNDGIPFDVDCLTIPFNKWRQESLKAYGNAIVPQVMYEIFNAIQTITN